MLPHVSVILPCFREGEHLNQSIADLLQISKSFDFTFELIFVEDGSPDNTKEILKKFESTLSNSRFIFHEKNRGRGAAIKSGYELAQGNIVGFIDIDLEISPKYIAEMIRALDNHDVAVAKRDYFYKMNFQSILRNILSKGYRKLCKLVLHHPYSDTESGFKFFKKTSVAAFFSHIENDHWFWDTEFMMQSHLHQLKVAEIPVEFIRSSKKTSTVKPLKDSIIYFLELLRYKRKLSSAQ